MGPLKLSGRVVGRTIELDGDIPELEGKSVVISIEEDDDAVAKAFRDAPVDEDARFTADDRVAVGRAKNGTFISTDELRRRLAARNSAGE